MVLLYNGLTVPGIGRAMSVFFDRDGLTVGAFFVKCVGPVAGSPFVELRYMVKQTMHLDIGIYSGSTCCSLLRTKKLLCRIVHPFAPMIPADEF